jgi:probable phosphoglycerate mutase
VQHFLPSLRGDSVLVSHGGVARVLMALIGGHAPSRAAAEDIWQGRVLVFRDGACRWVASHKSD